MIFTSQPSQAVRFGSRPLGSHRFFVGFAQVVRRNPGGFQTQSQLGLMGDDGRGAKEQEISPGT